MFKAPVFVCCALLVLSGCLNDEAPIAVEPGAGVTRVDPGSSMLPAEFTDSERMSAIAYSLKTDAPGGFTDTSWRYWDFCYIGAPPEHVYQAWYTCAQMYPMLIWQRHAYGSTVREAIDNTVAQLWFVPDPAGIPGDKVRLDWISGAADHSFYRDLQLDWNDYDPTVFSSNFATMLWGARPPAPKPWCIRAATIREAIDKSINVTGWGGRDGSPPCAREVGAAWSSGSSPAS